MKGEGWITFVADWGVGQGRSGAIIFCSRNLALNSCFKASTCERNGNRHQKLILYCDRGRWWYFIKIIIPRVLV